MVKTKSVKDLVEKSDGDRILVMRYWPRGCSKKDLKLTEWLRELGPSSNLLHDWKDGKISWEEYKTRYCKEMSEYKQEIGELARRAKSRTITLLCIEPEGVPQCHRHLLKELIDKELKLS